MNADQRRRILGDDVIAHIRAVVADAPSPPPEVIEVLRRIFAPSVRRRAEGREREGAPQRTGNGPLRRCSRPQPLAQQGAETMPFP